MNFHLFVERLSTDPVATLKSALIAGHLLGLVLGLGTATLLDAFILKFVLAKRITRDQYNIIDFFSKIVALGLLLLWLTGLGFLTIYSLFEPIKLSNEKIWAKIIIVGILSLNGVFIHRTTLPLIRDHIGRDLFDGLLPGQRSLLLSSGALSATSWYVPLLLGAFPQLNFFPVLPIVLAYLVLLLVAIVATHGLVRAVAPRERSPARAQSEGAVRTPMQSLAGNTSGVIMPRA